MERLCSVKDCNKKHYAKDYCYKHYTQIRRNGCILEDKPKTCSVPNCNRDCKAKGLCFYHYKVKYIMEKEIIIKDNYSKPKKCKIENCNYDAHGLGYCRTHYINYKRNNGIVIIKMKQNCSIEGCNNKYHAKGYCRSHYMKFIYKPKKLLTNK